MNYNDFEELLKKAKLTKKEFAELVKMNSGSVTNWKNTNKVPHWVSVLLNYHISNKENEELITLIREHKSISKKIEHKIS